MIFLTVHTVKSLFTNKNILASDRNGNRIFCVGPPGTKKNLVITLVMFFK